MKGGESPSMNSPLEPVSVVGLGNMGMGIAFLFAQLGSAVRICDISMEKTERDLGLYRSRIEGQISAGLLDSSVTSALNLLIPVSTPAEAAKGAGMVIEAVFEDLTVKQSVLGEISNAAAENCVIATNTSSFPIEMLNDFVKYPERFLGIHFFNPPELIPGVEVIPSSKTHPEYISAVNLLLRRVGKVPSEVRSSPGFIANRLQFALFREAMRCVEDGIATTDAIDEIVRTTFGFRLGAYGPFAIADMAGLDVYASILATLNQGLGERFDIPETLEQLVAAGHLGLKSGSGFKEYSAAATEQLIVDRNRAYSGLARFIQELKPTNGDLSDSEMETK
jgi:3-hydroxybutyryl-CoA dehydrogenase